MLHKNQPKTKLLKKYLKNWSSKDLHLLLKRNFQQWDIQNGGGVKKNKKMKMMSKLKKNMNKNKHN